MGRMRPYMSSESDNTSNTDPDRVYADMMRDDYMDFLADYGQFEEDLIKQAQTDTSLIDAAREDSESAGRLAGQMADRNASRYGGQLTPGQLRAQGRGLQRANTLG